jgi:HSP20 family protein
MAKDGKRSKRQAKNEDQETQSGKKRESRTKQANAQTSAKREPETGITRPEQAIAVRTISPFSFMRRFSEDMDRLVRDFGFGGGLASGLGREFGRLADLEGSMWLPQVEAFERDGKLIVRADLPGMTKDDIDVDITDDAIQIRGERRQEREENEEGYYRSERSYGSFYREIPLPSGVNREQANATFRNGMLEISMPAPARQSSSRRIEISEGTASEQQPRTMGKAAGR